MADDSLCSADTRDLDAFVDGSDFTLRRMTETVEELQTGRSRLAALPLPHFVEDTELPAYGELVSFMAGNGAFVRDVSSALKAGGTNTVGFIYEAPTSVIQNQIDKSNDERLGDYEQALIAQGLTRAEAAKIRAEVEAQLDQDPSLSFYDAALAGSAKYYGVTVEEFERRHRAFNLLPAEVGTVIDENFDAIAGQTGDKDKLTLDDLLLAVDDETLSPEVRDAAYRLAADGVLFNNMDVTKQTHLSDEPLGNGFRWNKIDGEISRDDAEQFNEKNHQAEILLVWHPLVETAGQNYDVSKVDSHASEKDVVAFISDPDIPLHVRQAVADVYQYEYFSVGDAQYNLEQEAKAVAARSVGVLERPPTANPPPVTPKPGTPKPGAPPRTAPPARGPGGGRGGGFALVALMALTAGWDYGTQKRIERDGDPTLVFTHPRTGQQTNVNPNELSGLTPEETKAWVSYYAAHGEPPPPGITEVAPYPYLDAKGQWRMSDTNEPVHVGPYSNPPAGQFFDKDGRLRYTSGDLVDGEPEREPELATDGAGARDGGDKPVDPKTPRERRVPEAPTTPPTWVREAGHTAQLGDANPAAAADRIMRTKYPEGNYPKGAGTDHSQIQKWLSRNYVWS